MQAVHLGESLIYFFGILHFHRYAGVYKHYGTLSCLCGSSYGRDGIGQCDDCTSTQGTPGLHCGSESSASIYDTGFKGTDRNTDPYSLRSCTMCTLV